MYKVYFKQTNVFFLESDFSPAVFSLGLDFELSLETGLDFNLGLGFESSLETGLEFSLGLGFESSLETGLDFNLGFGFELSLETGFEFSLEFDFEIFTGFSLLLDFSTFILGLFLRLDINLKSRF